MHLKSHSDQIAVPGDDPGIYLVVKTNACEVHTIFNFAMMLRSFITLKREASYR
jgi:hypothetical protein